MIKLFNANATNFNTCKYIMNKCLSATMTENIDGSFSIDIDYPLMDDIGKLIDRGMIIKCKCYDNRPDQLFRIRKRNRSASDKKVSLYAEAIARADLDTNIVLGVEVPAGKTRKEAIGIILNAIQDKRRIYNVGTKDTSVNTNINLGFDDNGNIINYLDIAYISPLKALLDESENSVYKAYGGEIEFNNFEINMFDERGNDNSFVVRSGKNLQDLQEEITDMGEDFATALIMCSSDGLYLPNNEILYSSYANQYDRYFYKVIKCDDVNLEDLVTENSTEQDIENAKNIVYEQLRERGKKYFKQQNDRLFGTYTINFLELAKTEEYKDYAELTHCALGNTVKTIYPSIGLSVENRVTEIKYNILTDRIEEITVGRLPAHDIADSINSTSNTANTAKNTATDAKTKVKKVSKDLSKTKRNITIKFEEYDEGLRAMVTEDTMWSLIQMNPDKILMSVNDEKNGTDVIIDTSGLKVYKGKFALYDSAGNKIFGVNQSGRVVIYESIDMRDSDGSDTSITTGGMRFQNSSGKTIARMSCVDNQDIVIESKNGYIDLKSDDIRINGQALDEYVKDVVI